MNGKERKKEKSQSLNNIFLQQTQMLLHSTYLKRTSISGDALKIWWSEEIIKERKKKY